jgi:hypothetical protein
VPVLAQREQGEQRLVRRTTTVLLVLAQGREPPQYLGRVRITHDQLWYASMGGQEQIRFRSPLAPSMRRTGGQTFVDDGPSGNAASSRV